jgi:DNA repair photolyase
MVLKEIQSKTILSTSKIHDYVINPYVGCQHGCSYCYARYIKKFTNHTEPWGQFVDVRINAADLLHKEIKKKKVGKVWVSGLCDCYQPLEAKYGVTRKCLEILAENNWPVSVQTRSPMVIRDIDIFKEAKNFEVGLTIPTADDGVRKIFEPSAPPIGERLRALDELHHSGIKTFAMIAPLLPGSEDLIGFLNGKTNKIIIDRMNYSHADWVYQKYGLEDQRTETYFKQTGLALAQTCKNLGINCNLVF